MTYQFHTISKQVLGDLQTPVSIYLESPRYLSGISFTGKL